MIFTTFAGAQTLSTFGTPGLLDMPTAETLEDGAVGITTSHYGKNSRNTFVFQVLPRVYGTFRYSAIRDFENRLVQPDRFDRSFDLHYQITDETSQRPAVAVGLRDFGGTGLFSGEYLVATKSFGDKFVVTGGLGWGRLAQHGGFENPLGYMSNSFKTRGSAAELGISTTGQLDIGQWFRGDIAPFGGVEYHATDRLSFQFEYSSDAYAREVQRGVMDAPSPYNIGLNYAFPSGSSLRAFVIGGEEVGLQYSYTFNPKFRRSPGGLDTAPLPIPPRSEARLASATLRDSATTDEARRNIERLLAAEGIALYGFRAEGSRATVWIQNGQWDVEAQAIGRAARVMANVLPPEIEDFVIIPEFLGVPQSAVELNRRDLREQQNAYDGAWTALARSKISDAYAPQPPGARLDGRYPAFIYELSPYTAYSFFDPDEPVRFDIGPQLALKYQAAPGTSLNGVFRYPLYSSIDDATRRSNSEIQKVRSDSALYAIESDFEVMQLFGEHLFRPGESLFGRVTAGYLEAMYGGVSSEVLWYPIESDFALGLELNYVKQRDFDMLLGFQDYEVLTGHASAYFDLGKGFTAQVDAGRYLAGDWGATLGIDREFNNGFKIGGYFTLTDVPFDEFGEGSFDKGIRFTVPVSWLSGEPSRSGYSQTIQPVLRDGGARLSVPNRLHDVTEDYRAQNLIDGWGRLFR